MKMVMVVITMTIKNIPLCSCAGTTFMGIAPFDHFPDIRFRSLQTMAESKEKTDALRVMLWGVPRSASTVFTKFMSFVDNVEIWHEPYVVSSLNENGWLTKNQYFLTMLKPLYDLYPEEKRGNLRLINTFSYVACVLSIRI